MLVSLNLAVSKNRTSVKSGEDLLLSCSSGFDKVDSLICLNSARKLVVDISSMISPLNSESSMSEYEK
jgi:hypothetical protein